MLVVLSQESHIWLSHYANGVPVDVEKDGKNEIDSDNHPMFRRQQLSNKDTSESCWLGPLSCFHIVWMIKKKVEEMEVDYYLLSPHPTE